MPCAYHASPFEFIARFWRMEEPNEQGILRETHKFGAGGETGPVNYPEATAAIQAIIAAAGSSDGSEADTCAPDQVAFAIPNKTGGCFPIPPTST